MIQCLRNSTIISDQIYAFSPIEYRTNDDLTFELPEVTIRTTIANAVVDDTITLRDSSITPSVQFYIAEITYDYKTKLYQWRCPHILHRLTRFKCREITNDWSDITPTFAQYNNQTSSGQGQSRWARRYWQVLYLMQVLIRKATGLGINAIDVSVGVKDSQYYSRTQQPNSQWVTTIRPISSLGISGPSMTRLGSRTHLDYQATDYDSVQKLPNALQLLRWLCASCGLVIDIFRSDYSILEYGSSAVPSDGAAKRKRDLQFEPYRKYTVTGKRLVVGSFDYIYGTYDDLGLFQPYTYGIDGATYELTPDQAELIDGASGRNLDVVWPNLFKLYFINDRGDYQSDIFSIYDAELGKDFIDQWLDYIYGKWGNYVANSVYDIIMPGIVHRQRRVELDIENKRMTYEVIS
jgi:hypothetical protein